MMDFKYYFENLPPDTPSCGFIGELCDQRGWDLELEREREKKIRVKNFKIKVNSAFL